MEPCTINVSDLRDRLHAHEVYAGLSSPAAIRRFMEAHVFAVWDFMSLVKELQRRLTCVDVPWVPVGNPEARRFLNEIVLDEESDLGADGEPISHFEMYVSAMQSAGASTDSILSFVGSIRAGTPRREALRKAQLPTAVAAFVNTTLDFTLAKTHEVAAAFTYGREDVIPSMFMRVISGLNSSAPDQWRELHFYLERHIECDNDKHGPIAKRLLANLCGQDELAWQEAETAARQSLQTRIALWDYVAHEIKSTKPDRAGAGRRWARVMGADLAPAAG